ncbi:MAG: S9 family peptidase, partial [bacterium]|nr:S9 family peptidase [bacterium]
MSINSYGQSAGVPGPSFKDIMNIKSLGSPVISPDGKSILYTIRKTDWDKNGYDTEIWISKDGQDPFQLTWTKDGSSSSQAWSPDGNWISFIANREDKRQVYLISPNGGEAFKYTDHKEGINSYKWSPDGSKIAFTSTEPESEVMKSREKTYGRFEVEDAEYRVTHLWVVDVNTDDPSDAVRLTEGEDLTIGSYNWSPDSRKIVFDHRPDPLINSFTGTDISIIDISTKTITPVVAQPGSDSGPVWSPDGRWILFGTKMGDTRYYTNGELAKVRASGGEITVLTENFDENLSVQKWTRNGIYCLASQTVYRKLFLLDPESGNVELVADTPENISRVSFASDERTIALNGYDRTSMTEIYKTKIDAYKPVKITNMTAQAAGWRTGEREVITWKSKDGAMIEGVLWKPEGYDPDKKYPLFVIIHGGPTGTS